MNRRSVIKLAGATALAAPFTLRGANAQGGTVRIGVVGPRTGVMASGAAVSHFPNFKLWEHEVNSAGGLKLKGGQKKVELIEYDDRSQPGETIKSVERLAAQDKVDFIMPVYGTGYNLAAAPVYAKYGYPQVTQAAVTDQIDTLTQRYPSLFFVQGSTTSFASSAANVLKKLKDEGKIGNKVAIVNVADAFGIELANAGQPIFQQAGFDIVYDKSYPLGTQDYAPVMKAAKAANPDAFVAWSYPPDTFGLAEQAKIEGLNVKAYYSAVAVAYPAFRAKYGASIENVLGAGGIQDSPAIREYYRKHKEVTGVDADYWASPLYYTFLQILTQTFEAVGSFDRDAITRHLKTHTFKAVIGDVDIRKQKLDRYWTVGQWQDGFFHAVAGVGFTDYKPVRLKTGWA
ncbi:MAG: amino acid ABC transporter substrate-binding protein [Xanthobacteraceae bacterium]|nr:amino acid ABC transporter substrate-binding protein [Xanthobacteraceae bacterium]